MKSLRFQLPLFCALILANYTSSFAQAVSEKKLQGGVTGSVGLNFPKMGTNLLSGASGFSSSFGVSFTKASKESQNIALTAGLEFDIEKINYKVTGTDVYYRFTDKQIKTKDDLAQLLQEQYDYTLKQSNRAVADVQYEVDKLQSQGADESQIEYVIFDELSLDMGDYDYESYPDRDQIDEIVALFVTDAPESV
jgi:hypothetical protein